MKRVFVIDDLILPGLKLPDPCPVRIRITDEYVSLHVGPRDWQWRLSNGELSSCGTIRSGSISANIAPEPSEQPA